MGCDGEGSDVCPHPSRHSVYHLTANIRTKTMTKRKKDSSVTVVEACRKIYEANVNQTIKPEFRDEFLKVGSTHWLDFKNGFITGHHFALSVPYIGETKQ